MRDGADLYNGAMVLAMIFKFGQIFFNYNLILICNHSIGLFHCENLNAGGIALMHN